MLQTGISGKYNSPFYFCFLSFFSYDSSCSRKDQFTALIFQFGIEDFTDPGLLRILLTITGLSLRFCLHKCFLCSHYFKQLDNAQKNHDLIIIWDVVC